MTTVATAGAWSFDGATTWAPVTRAPLLVCAHANSAVTTVSGVVLVAGRFPGIALMVSWDDAMSWEWYLIDTSGFAANGALVEVEPDVVMYIYGGSYSPVGYRTQLFKVDRVAQTATSIERSGQRASLDLSSKADAMTAVAQRPIKRTLSIEF